MKNTGFTLVEVLIVVGIIGGLASMTVPKVLRTKIAANDTIALKELQTFADALEQFSILNGHYTTNYDDLVTATPPYARENIIEQTKNGYTFAATISTESEYTFTATPVTCNQTGSKIITITQGRTISQTPCS